MDKTNGAEQQPGVSAVEGGTLDWETLPDLAKDRWEEAVAYDLTVETQLARAQSNRGQAEVERQRVAGEILEATREVCHEIASDARKALEAAKYMEIDAHRKHLDAETALKKAESTLLEANANAEMIVSRARQEAVDVVTKGRSEAEKESEQIIQRTTHQARKTLAQVQMMKAAAQEEMETQRIYTQVARLKVESMEALSEVKGIVDRRPESPEQGSDDSPRALQTTGDPLWEEVAESLSVEPAGNHSAEEQVAVEPVSASANASGQQANETAKPRSKKQSGK